METTPQKMFTPQDLSLNRSLPKYLRPLLNQPIKQLTPKLETTGFHPLFQKLDEELQSKGLIHLKIEIYLGDEWFCPDQTTAISVPFWLADQKLRQIEKSFIGELEGETTEEFMALLRHEAGHCVEHAYKLSQTKIWQKIFGNPSIPYAPENVKTTTNHPDFVNHLPGNYAQTHPEEDFAESFAVWLNPHGYCWNTYRDQPKVLEKFLYIEKIVSKIGSQKTLIQKNTKPFQARRMSRTLQNYYEHRLRKQNLKN